MYLTKLEGYSTPVSSARLGFLREAKLYLDMSQSSIIIYGGALFMHAPTHLPDSDQQTN